MSSLFAKRVSFFGVKGMFLVKRDVVKMGSFGVYCPSAPKAYEHLPIPIELTLEARTMLLIPSSAAIDKAL